MKNCYVSQYLNIIPLEDTDLLFNGYNGCIDEVSKGLGGLLSNNECIVPSEAISGSEIEFLLKRGHITNLTKEEELLEFKKFVKKLDEYHLKSSEQEGSLMLLLSYDCNLNCYYCYQKPIRHSRANKIMTKEFIDALFNEYYEKLLHKISKKQVGITLYGGEPFLVRNREVVEKVLEYAQKYCVHVGAISNCTQIEHYSDLLGPLPGMINFIQASFDGNRENHDKSRVSDPARPTFETILKNIHFMLDKKVKLNIRINIEANALSTVEPLYRLLEEEDILNHPYAYVYLHPLHNHFNQTDDSTFLNHEEVAATFEAMCTNKKIRHPIRRKAEGLTYLLELQKGIAFRKTRFCMQNIPNNYLIDPYGDLYVCYEEAGREELKIGSLANGEVSFTPLRDEYLERNILNLDDCLKCSVALLCGGECGVQARENNGNIFTPYCGSRKKELFEALKYVYKEREEEKNIDHLNMLFPNL